MLEGHALAGGDLDRQVNVVKASRFKDQGISHLAAPNTRQMSVLHSIERILCQLNGYGII